MGLDDLVNSGVPLERHVLELHDEIRTSGPVPEAPPASQPREEASRQRKLPEKPAQPTALVSGPMSFDS